MTKFDVKHLLAVVEHGSFSKAAKALDVSQPYLSNRVKALEVSVGVELLNRKTHPIAFTEAGEMYITSVQKLEQDYKILLREIEQLSASDDMRLVIGTHPTLAYILRNILPSFLALSPQTELKVSEELQFDLNEHILLNKVDLCFTVQPVIDRAIVSERVLQGTPYVLIPKGHRLYNEHVQEITPLPFEMKQLATESFVLLKESYVLRREINHYFNLLNIHPKILMETSSMDTILQFVAANLGISIIPSYAVDSQKLQNTNIYTLPQDSLSCDVYINYAKAKQSDALNLLIETTKSSLAQ
ncbi:LysR family transcriptional regulator [Caryophanon tenue]|uniref:HTH lysR-type domain-containing protein n=1 Tax=Caryophanon tenue TaxID=33978 RepID=A0A1C0Y7C1_9BACL|nr:LysR family transcriptional regulator [Caryophanon tenue]OCS83050.1 hypothetical protein A6M13_06515 [Caryophanon tenue]